VVNREQALEEDSMVLETFNILSKYHSLSSDDLGSLDFPRIH
jgi:hypothetical protein